MRSRFVMSFSGSASRIAVAAALAATLAACGTDVSRFADTPLAGVFDPSGSKDPDVTASLAPPAPVASGSVATGGMNAQSQALSAPAGSVSSAPLSPVASAPLAAPVSTAPLAAPQALPPVAQATNGPRPKPVEQAAPIASNIQGWTAQGGATVTLGQGETIRTLAGRYGVPEAAIRSANNISGNPAPGTRVVIPVYQSNVAAAPVKAAPAVAASAKQTAQAPAPLPAPQAVATKQVAAAQPAKTDLPQRPNQPGKTDLPQKQPTAAAPAEPVKQAKVEPATAPQKGKQAAPAAEPAPVAPVAAAAPAAAVAAKEETTAALGSSATSGGTEFRWPAKGRIIQGFGGGSDGINIALPEGTPVKAVENGVVAYAGNELKGYGNLVLIRHENGYVSAYANNGELKVKRGEQVKRGQTIATSGQSGNVSSPQLHFELRKGSTPVDPMPYLAGGG